jgi:hypothetical protein
VIHWALREKHLGKPWPRWRRSGPFSSPIFDRRIVVPSIPDALVLQMPVRSQFGVRDGHEAAGFSLVQVV